MVTKREADPDIETKKGIIKVHEMSHGKTEVKDDKILITALSAQEEDSQSLSSIDDEHSKPNTKSSPQ
jgi:hypothetical protein